MSEQNKHHHRKSKSDKSATRGSDDKYPGNSSTRSSGKGAQGTVKLHFADATLQTPGEHATDEKTDPSLNDKTTATP